MQERRDKGLCFNCDECYIVGDKCKKSHFYDWLEWGGREQWDKKGRRKGWSVYPCIEWVDKFSNLEVGWMLGKPATILIDNGSTHNFINQKKAANISLPITHPIPFVVQVANGANIKWPMEQISSAQEYAMMYPYIYKDFVSPVLCICYCW